MIDHLLLASITKLPPAVIGPVIAATGDPFAASKSLFDSWAGKFKIVAGSIAILVLVVTGIAYALGGNDTKHGAKKKWIDVGFAVAIIFGATAIITWFIGFLQQNGFQ